MFVRRIAPLCLLACTLAACSSQEPPAALVHGLSKSITLMIWDPDRILGPIRARIPRFVSQSGIKVNIKPAHELNEIFAASQSPNTDVDVVIGLNVWVGDF